MSLMEKCRAGICHRGKMSAGKRRTRKFLRGNVVESLWSSLMDGVQTVETILFFCVPVGFVFPGKHQRDLWWRRLGRQQIKTAFGPVRFEITKPYEVNDVIYRIPSYTKHARERILLLLFILRWLLLLYWRPFKTWLNGTRN